MWAGADTVTDLNSCFGDNESIACYTLAFAAVTMVASHVGKVASGADDAARAAARQADVGDGKRVIQLYAYRGTGRTAPEFIDAEPLIYAGHGGLSLNNGEVIFGLTPYAPNLSGSEVLEALKEKISFPGQVCDDTAIFHRAQDLAEQGYRTQVYVLSLEISGDDFIRIKNQIMGEMSKSPMRNKRYAFPGPLGCYNCVTWPSSLGLHMPEQTGNMRYFMPAMIQAGAKPWNR